MYKTDHNLEKKKKLIYSLQDTFGHFNYDVFVLRDDLVFTAVYFHQLLMTTYKQQTERVHFMTPGSSDQTRPADLPDPATREVNPNV